jgi:predicted nucleic acid-binding Zn ribbon protein
VRRLAPRPLSAALAAALPDATPAGLLPRVQAAWREVAGAAVAAEAEPVAESAGVVTVACRAAVWAQELELLAGDLLGRLNAALSGLAAGGPVATLRFVVRDP